MSYREPIRVDLRLPSRNSHRNREENARPWLLEETSGARAATPSGRDVGIGAVILDCFGVPKFCICSDLSHS